MHRKLAAAAAAAAAGAVAHSAGKHDAARHVSQVCPMCPAEAMRTSPRLCAACARFVMQCGAAECAKAMR